MTQASWQNEFNGCGGYYYAAELLSRKTRVAQKFVSQMIYDGVLNFDDAASLNQKFGFKIKISSLEKVHEWTLWLNKQGSQRDVLKLCRWHNLTSCDALYRAHLDFQFWYATALGYRNLTQIEKTRCVHTLSVEMQGDFPRWHWKDNLNIMALILDLMPHLTLDTQESINSAFLKTMFSRKYFLDHEIRQRILATVDHGKLLHHALNNIQKAVDVYLSQSSLEGILKLTLQNEENIRTAIVQKRDWNKCACLVDFDHLLHVKVFSRVLFSTLAGDVCIELFKQSEEMFNRITAKAAFPELWERYCILKRDQIDLKVALYVQKALYIPQKPNNFCMPSDRAEAKELFKSIESNLAKLKSDRSYLSVEMFLKPADLGSISGCCFGISLQIAKAVLSVWKDVDFKSKLLAIAKKHSIQTSREAIVIQVSYLAIHCAEYFWKSLLDSLCGMMRDDDSSTQIAVLFLVGRFYGIEKNKFAAYLAQKQNFSAHISSLELLYSSPHLQVSGQSISGIFDSEPQAIEVLERLLPQLGVSTPDQAKRVQLMVQAFYYAKCLRGRCAIQWQSINVSTAIIECASELVGRSWGANSRKLPLEPIYQMLNIDRHIHPYCSDKDDAKVIAAWLAAAEEGVYELEFITHKSLHVSCLVLYQETLYLLDPNKLLEGKQLIECSLNDVQNTLHSWLLSYPYPVDKTHHGCKFAKLTRYS